MVLFAKQRDKFCLYRFACAHAYAESCKPVLYCTLATGVVFLRCMTMIPKYLKRKVGDTVGSTDNLQILFAQNEMEIQRSA